MIHVPWFAAPRTWNLGTVEPQPPPWVDRGQSVLIYLVQPEFSQEIDGKPGGDGNHMAKKKAKDKGKDKKKK
jgi:hypothetical protein